MRRAAPDLAARWPLALALLLLAGRGAGRLAQRARRGSRSPATPAPSSPRREQVARGAYLARAGNCAACHTDRGGAAFAGGKGIATPFGTVSTRATSRPTRSTGIGAWSAAQFWRAMHNGRSADGRLLYPAFPYPNFTEITRADADALFAFLRSQVPVAQANRAARAALSVQPAGLAGRLARAVLHARRLRAGGRALGAVEPRRLPGALAGPLRRLPFAAQRVRRHARQPGAERRPDPAAELVRAVARLERRGRRGRLVERPTWPRCSRPASRRAAPRSGRWPRWCSAARSTWTTRTSPR